MWTETLVTAIIYGIHPRESLPMSAPDPTIKKAVEALGLPPKGASLLVGLSGGPDSVCLLHVLASLAKEQGWTLSAAHLNHCTRGEQSDRDEALAREVCESMDVPFFLRRVDVPRIAKRNGESIETAARLERYQFFRDLAEARGVQAVALAHNADDQVETILFRILRGTGLRGLSGIPASRPLYRGAKAVVVRPLLGVSRDEILRYLKARGLRYRLDKSNYQSRHARNELRHKLLPLLRDEYNVNIDEALTGLSAVAAEACERMTASFQPEGWLRAEADGSMLSCKVSEVEGFNELQSMLLLETAVEQLTGEFAPVNRESARRWLALMSEGGAPGFDMAGGIAVWREYGDLLIGRREFHRSPEPERVAVPGSTALEAYGLRVDCAVVAHDAAAFSAFRSSKTAMQEWFDADALGGDLQLRCWEEGDQFQPLGMQGSKKLQDLFVDLKLPRRLRHTVPLLVGGGRIAWVVGHRIAEPFRIHAGTTRVARVCVEPAPKAGE